MNVHICRLADYGCTYARIVTFVPTIPQYLIAAQSFMCEILKKKNNPPLTTLNIHTNSNEQISGKLICFYVCLHSGI